MTRLAQDKLELRLGNLISLWLLLLLLLSSFSLAMKSGPELVSSCNAIQAGSCVSYAVVLAIIHRPGVMISFRAFGKLRVAIRVASAACNACESVGASGQNQPAKVSQLAPS